jgi:hypothetical protein
MAKATRGTQKGWAGPKITSSVLFPGEDGPPFGKDNEQPRDDATIERFFQPWLYFGTAIEFFKVGGGHVLDTESFLVLLPPPESGKAYIVQTTYLRMYLVELWGKSTRDKESLWKEVTPIL